ncbi:hypothetical protein [Meiothermus granaticius]|uniref:Uncharacterized protein n=1 Tax=Meiothermus granaticius NBRC 107808 TaxID=1227551 RepID=A0A399F6F0_9DEIN|nr:hypothetical protein [Meiothermus granaticius]RIH91693.1 hypothetical protein Mgrana_02359 [Meiothermus granaticius NBRC 107808]GEM88515.1 hypothetical protein MGR01S_31400 [Meiothermus granaticius NBRC 107808]
MLKELEQLRAYALLPYEAERAALGEHFRHVEPLWDSDWGGETTNF